MKKAVLVLSLALAFALVLCLCLSSCGHAAARDPFLYADSPFTLTVRGELCLPTDPDLASGTVGKIRTGEPLPFSAKVSSQPLPAGTVADGVAASEKLYRVSIAYTAPEALAGLTVACVYGGSKTVATATLTYPSPAGGVTVSLPFGTVSGLLTPILTLLPEGDVSDVSPMKDGARTVTCRSADGKAVTYHFAEDRSYPVKVESEEGRLMIYADPEG